MPFSSIVAISASTARGPMARAQSRQHMQQLEARVHALERELGITTRWQRGDGLYQVRVDDVHSCCALVLCFGAGARLGTNHWILGA